MRVIALVIERIGDLFTNTDAASSRKRLAILIVAAVIGIAVWRVSVLVNDYNDTKEWLADVQYRLGQELKAKEMLQLKLDSVNNELSAARLHMKDLEDTIVGLNIKVEGAQKANAALASTKAELEKRISALEQRISVLESEKSALEVKMGSVESLRTLLHDKIIELRNIAKEKRKIANITALALGNRGYLMKDGRNLSGVKARVKKEGNLGFSI